MRYRISRGRVEVRARANLGDTVAVWSQPSGFLTFDPDAPTVARAEIALDMAAFDAGDSFKTWKLRGDLGAERHPAATFKLMHFVAVNEIGPGRFAGRAVGQLAWAEQSTNVEVKGEVVVDRHSLELTARFALDVRELGVKPPRFLLYKVDDVVAVSVALYALAAPDER